MDAYTHVFIYAYVDMHRHALAYIICIYLCIHICTCMYIFYVSVYI